jgi:hypothetical protein
MSSPFLEALAELNRSVKSIGSLQDSFAEREQQGDFMLFATPGSLPSTAAASVEVIASTTDEAGPAPEPTDKKG